MKNQYVGDINDYVKYSIIRHLVDATHQQLATVCWLLTDDDQGTDGSLRAYLSSPDRYRAFDPEVFDALASVSPGIHGVTSIEEAGLIAGADYFSKVLSDSPEARRDYFDELWLLVRSGSLIFFDPDNGLEIKSVPKGRRSSAKFLYMDELSVALERGNSVVTYQHFPRQPREAYIATRVEEIRALTPQHDVFAICTSRVAYLTAAASQDQPGLIEAARSVVDQWGGLIRLVL